MTNFFTSITLFVIILNLVTAHDLLKDKATNFVPVDVDQKTTHISPELINELKDFENLIPKATVDEIVAKHYLFDGNFRTALTYLRSEEFTQLEKQLLCVPEIIDVLEFLHLTVKNATTMHMSATKMPTTAGSRVVASLDEYNVAVGIDSYKRIDKMTTNSDGILTKAQTMIVDNEKEEATNNLKVPKRPQKQFYIKETSNNKNYGLDEHNINKDDDDDDNDDTVNANSIAYSEQQPLVHIVLLEDLEVKAKTSNKGEQQQQQHQPHHHHQHHHHKYKRQRHNSYHRHSSLGTFTSFVEEVLQHLPNSAYQKMITDKCRNNPKFAKFYHALRSPVFKPYLQGLKTKPNIQPILATLNSHDVDVNALENIVFEVISWGPNI